MAGLTTLACALVLTVMPVNQSAAWFMLIFSCIASLFMLPLRASLEVQERFGLINVLRVVGTSSMFLAPALATALWPTLTAAAAALLASRLALLAIFAFKTRDIFALMGHRSLLAAPPTWRGFRLPTLHQRLVTLGGWLGAAGLVSMLIGYADRFVLGIVSSTAIVADYTVVSELVTKGWLVTGALIAAATPRLAHSWTHATASFRQDFLLLAALLAVVAMTGHVVLLFEGDRILRIWLGQNYRPGMVDILRVLSVGIAVNALSIPNYLLMVLGGRERQAAYVQFVALPLTVLASLAAARYYGAIGVAWVFSARLTLDIFVIRAFVPQTPSGARTGVPTLAIIGWIVCAYGLYWLAR
jgi:O-antigen/teichoic acid export membrane protein